MKKLLITLFIISLQTPLWALSEDSLFFDNHRNTIRINPTPNFVLGSGCVVIGYERIVKPYQSFSVNIGYLQRTPTLSEYTSGPKVFDEKNRGGFDFSLDYRFYSKQRNKRPAPDGLYWGPYTSYYGLWWDASADFIVDNIKVNTAHMETKFNMYNIGVQLGYQFVIKERFTIDLILVGPSISVYDINLGLKMETETDSNDPALEDLLELVEDSAPFLSEILKNQSFDTSGRIRFGYYGFRYGLQLGYRF